MSEALGTRAALTARADAIEQAYEFFLAYASQGLPIESGGGHQVRDSLATFDRALDGFADFLTGHIEALGLDATPFRAFLAVIDRDARDTRAAIELVLAQPSINSQIIDNFNASIHVRALLTDLFLIDEVLKHREQKSPA